MMTGEVIEAIAAFVRDRIENFDAEFARSLAAIDADDREDAHAKADRMVADALDQLGFTESAKAYKKMCERFYYA